MQCYKLQVICGGIAQLGERLHGMQEVSSSILLISTKFEGLLLKSGETRRKSTRFRPHRLEA